MGNCSSSKQAKGLFRDGKYHKVVKIGKRRVKDGECCAIWNSSGQVRNVVGPKREWIWMSDVRFLDRFVANQDQYLAVCFRDGRKEHIRGPASFFLDPVLHKSIRVEQAISLNAFEAIVVYREDGEMLESDESKEAETAGTATGGDKGGALPVACAIALPAHGQRVQRRVVRGPTLFIPGANEWVHTFSWHGSNNQMDERRTMVKDALKLTKIRTLPDQLYYNVAACRTSDDAQVSSFLRASDVQHCSLLTNTCPCPRVGTALPRPSCALSSWCSSRCETSRRCSTRRTIPLATS